MGDKTEGLYDKFRVSRVDGSDAPGGKHHGCRYYVLDIDHDRFAIAAINAYARACKPHYPFLADDLESLVGIEDDPSDRRIAELEARLKEALDYIGTLPYGQDWLAERQIPCPMSTLDALLAQARREALEAAASWFLERTPNKFWGTEVNHELLRMARKVKP